MYLQELKKFEDEYLTSSLVYESLRGFSFYYLQKPEKISIKKREIKALDTVQDYLEELSDNPWQGNQELVLRLVKNNKDLILTPLNVPENYTEMVILTERDFLPTLALKAELICLRDFLKFSGRYKFYHNYFPLYREVINISDLEDLDLSEEIFRNRLDRLSYALLFMIIVIILSLLAAFISKFFQVIAA